MLTALHVTEVRFQNHMRIRAASTKRRHLSLPRPTFNRPRSKFSQHRHRPQQSIPHMLCNHIHMPYRLHRLNKHGHRCRHRRVTDIRFDRPQNHNGRSCPESAKRTCASSGYSNVVAYLLCPSTTSTSTAFNPALANATRILAAATKHSVTPNPLEVPLSD